MPVRGVGFHFEYSHTEAFETSCFSIKAYLNTMEPVRGCVYAVFFLHACVCACVR